MNNHDHRQYERHTHQLDHRAANGQSNGHGLVEQHTVVVLLTEEEKGALEAWREANLSSTLSDAARQLMRLGLQGELARIQMLVSDVLATMANDGSPAHQTGRIFGDTASSL